MYLEQLKFVRFRCFAELSVKDFAPVNCLIGDNGAGKTNLLEGIYLLSSGRGFRTADRRELALRGSDGFYLGGVFDGEKIEKLVSEKKKKLTVSERDIGVHELRAYNPIVVFNPGDIFLATGSSEVRRRFFDSAISLRDPGYMPHLLTYERALRQRNASLKKDPRNAGLWDGVLIQSGAELIKRRIAFAKLLVPKIEALYGELAGGKASLKYFNNFSLSSSIEDSLKEAMAQAKTADLRIRHTTKGPHRDDVSIYIDGLPAALSGSQGQNRTLAFAMKLGSVEIVEESLGRKPILLVDDALLETDASKRKRIFEKMRSMGLQVFLTATDAAFFNFIDKKEARFFDFREGQVQSIRP